MSVLCKGDIQEMVQYDTIEIVKTQKLKAQKVNYAHTWQKWNSYVKDK